MRVNYAKFDDETLLRQIASAQPDALSELYDRYGRLVYSVAYQATADPDMADEITQDTFLRVWQRAESFNPQQGRAATWLTSIARHRAIDLFRRAQTSGHGHAASLEDMPDFEPPDEAQDVESHIELTLRQEQIRQALARLPVEQRRVLALAYFRGHTQEEIAQALGEPLGTVKTRMRLAMQKLRQFIPVNLEGKIQAED